MLSVTINGCAYGPREVRDELLMNDFLREYLGMTGTKFRLRRRAVHEPRGHHR
jgi:aerobic-type carbon monoxide dehydrogenase small subunit (CoxS/CutS family)